jgi:hypothetical protein
MQWDCMEGGGSVNNAWPSSLPVPGHKIIFLFFLFHPSTRMLIYP